VGSEEIEVLVLENPYSNVKGARMRNIDPKDDLYVPKSDKNIEFAKEKEPKCKKLSFTGEQRAILNNLDQKEFLEVEKEIEENPKAKTAVLSALGALIGGKFFDFKSNKGVKNIDP